MKYAVIEVGGQQHLVKADQEIEIDLMEPGKKKLQFEPLLVIDEKQVTVGTPAVKGTNVSAEVVEEKVAGEKLQVIRYKAKKRVKKISGHRQKYTRIKITSIS